MFPETPFLRTNTNKLPWDQFFWKDWLTDPELTLCSLATRGAWADLIGTMHNKGRVGQLRGTADQLCRFARCSPAEIVLALTELQATNAADVTLRNGVYAVTNRRMMREYKDRASNALRQKRFRERVANKDPVTPPTLNVNSESESEENSLSVKTLNVETLNVQSFQREKDFMRELRQAFESYDGEQARIEVANNGGKWRLRFRKDPRKCERLLAEVVSMIKEGRIRSNAGACADDLWNRFT